MVKHLLKWISGIFTPQAPNKPKRDFCYWCHSKNCPHPDFEACKNHRNQCKFHPEVKDGSSPSFCHRCSYGWDSSDKWTKPTIYKPNVNKADTRWCLDWICEACDKRDREREDLWSRQNQDTAEAAELSFTKDGDEFFYYDQPLTADFPLSYESLAPYVKRIHKIADSSLSGGIEWSYISIREGCVYIHDELREYKEWGDDV